MVKVSLFSELGEVKCGSPVQGQWASVSFGQRLDWPDGLGLFGFCGWLKGRGTEARLRGPHSFDTN